MKNKLIGLLAIILFPVVAFAQSYNENILKFRQDYINAFLTDKNSPLAATDTGYLRFYPIDRNFRVSATFKKTANSKPFMIPTHSGKEKEYREYGVLKFTLHDTVLTLHVYQSITLSRQDEYKNYLFIPFTDLTNYTETFGGGRYIDLSISDIKNGHVILDFNKCYNPYCAFKDGYSCPIPPKENSLPVAIKVGELLFSRPVTE